MSLLHSDIRVCVCGRGTGMCVYRSIALKRAPVVRGLLVDGARAISFSKQVN